jgi:hypothetical protein
MAFNQFQMASEQYKAASTQNKVTTNH